jgi:hypothetical protein
MTSTTQLAASPKTFLERDDWIRAILASDLPDAAVRVAIRLALYLRVNTGRCDPSYPILAAESHVSERSVYRLVDLLERKGWIGLQRTRGRGRSNQYALLKPASHVAGFAAEKTCHSSGRVSPVKPAKSTNKTCQDYDRFSAVKPATALAGEQRKREEREQRKRESISADRAPRRKKKRKTDARKQPPGPELAAEFERFWAAYPRRVAKEAARTAFAKAIEGGATPDELVAGAKRYAVERSGEAPRYTKHPATWLNKGCWTDEAPGAPVIDETGNVVAFERPPAERREPQGFMEISRQMAAEARARGDTWYPWLRR